MKSMCQDARRNSPSVADWSPTSLCIRTTSLIASSSTARSRSAESCPVAKPSRASRSSGGRSRLPTWSARNGGLSRGMLVQAQELPCVSLVDPVALGARDVEHQVRSGYVGVAGDHGRDHSGAPLAGRELDLQVSLLEEALIDAVREERRWDAGGVLNSHAVG